MPAATANSMKSLPEQKTAGKASCSSKQDGRSAAAADLPVIEIGIVSWTPQEFAAVVGEARASGAVIRVFDTVDVEKALLKVRKNQTI